MKMTSLAFIEEYINDAFLMEKVREYIFEKGRSPEQPRKWKKELPMVPKYLKKNSNADETIWVLIRYVGANETLSICDSDEILETPHGIQRAIAVDLKKGDTVRWKLYQSHVSDIHHNDVKDGIRTFKVKIY